MRRSYVFCGARAPVLERMLETGQQFAGIYVVPGTYLQRMLDSRGIAYRQLADLGEFTVELESMNFDVLLSNGCPFILPVGRLAEATGARFVNIHPSALPDMRGPHAISGAVLLGRDSGATCHVMDDTVDTGPIISRVEIPYAEDLDSGMLYQMCFLAEQEAYELAHQRGFEPLNPQPTSPDGGIYYARVPEDSRLDFEESGTEIVRRVLAANAPSRGATFEHHGTTIRVFDAGLVTNSFMRARVENYRDREVVFRYWDALVFRRGSTLVGLKRLEGDVDRIVVGDILGDTRLPVSGDHRERPPSP